MEHQELTQEEFQQFLEKRVHAALGMSVAEFRDAVEKRRLDPELPHVAGLAILVGARTR